MSLAGCGSSQTQGSSDTKGSSTLKVEVLAPVTGSLSLQGQEKVNAVKIAADKINSAGGIKGQKIETVVEDDQGMNPGAVSAFQKLSARKDLIAILGPAPSTQTKSLLNSIEETCRKPAKPKHHDYRDSLGTKGTVYRVTQS